ncbi:MAG: hypothetical protein M3Y21_08205 [Candidatus Eremiobacteraeota bacterium]|nr:hypothetical protein [Candidatus Eremiobacteraeota bacterium]
MRLLELQRAALGVVAPPPTTWNSDSAFEGLPTSQPEEPPAASGAMLSVEANASPLDGVIPGAVVTLSLSVANDGTADARGIRVATPLPGGAAYRNGSFIRDGRPIFDDEADEFFGNGLLIPILAAKARATFVWKISVRMGSKPLTLMPLISAQGVAIIGARPLVIARKGDTATAFHVELPKFDPLLYSPEISLADERPFYELDDEETLVHEAVDSALTLPTTKPIEPILDRPPEPKVEQIPMETSSSATATHETFVLLGGLDRPTLSYFERVFNAAKPPALLQHFLFAGAIACTRPADDRIEDLGLKTHQDAQSQHLQRAVLHEKLGKKAALANYAGELLTDLARLVPGDVQPPANSSAPGTIALRAELTEAMLSVTARIAAEPQRWDFVRARQLALALQAQFIIGEVTAEDRAETNAALRFYAQTAMTTLQRFFVRARLDPTTATLSVRDPLLDTAARKVLNAFSAVLSTM